MLNISQETVKTLPIALPTIDRQADIVTAFDFAAVQLSAPHAKVSRSIDLLRDYRSALITEAVTGQLDIDAWRGRGDAQLDRIAAEAGE